MVNAKQCLIKISGFLFMVGNFESEGKHIELPGC